MCRYAQWQTFCSMKGMGFKFAWVIMASVAVVHMAPEDEMACILSTLSRTCP